MEPVLNIEGLHVHLERDGARTHAVRGVDLQVGVGEAVGMVGESGCGKTMTALAVMGLLPPGGRISAGAVELAGEDLVGADHTRLSDLRGNDVAMIFQDPLSALNPTKTVGQQVAETVTRHRGAGRREAWDRAVECLQLVGLPSPEKRARDYPHRLSGGQRQRVMIASAIACEPKLLIADEPTTALDVTVQAQILDLLSDLRERLSMALLLVTHDLGVVAGHVDRAVAMYAGRIVESAPTAALFAAPRHRYLEALLQSNPERAVLHGHRLRSIPGQPPDLRLPIDGCAFATRCAHATPECTASTPPAYREGEHFFACLHPAGDGAAVHVTEPRPERVLPAEPATVLRMEEVVKEFPVRSGLLGRVDARRVSALAGVSLSLAAGETLGVVGESGCGKTTLGRIAVALERPTAGRVEVAGHDLFAQSGSGLRRHRRAAQLVFQDSVAALDPRMTIGQTLAEPLQIEGKLDRAGRRRRVGELLDEVGLPADARHRYPHEFSGGQRQRVNLARALALEPALIVADEPVSALDVSVQSQILNLLERVRAEEQLALLFISHDLSVVRYLADRVAVMFLGKLVEIGPADQVHTRPRHPYTRALIDAAPSVAASALAPAAGERRTTPAPGEPVTALEPPSGCRFRLNCPLATERCAIEEPVHDGGAHSVACHYPLDAGQDGAHAG